MKRLVLILPFIALVICAALCSIKPATWSGIAFLIALLVCLAAVPLLSRIKLIYGYLGLLFLLLTFTWLTLDPNRMETTVTVVEEGTITGENSDALENGESLTRMNDEISKQEKAPPSPEEQSPNP